MLIINNFIPPTACKNYLIMPWFSREFGHCLEFKVLTLSVFSSVNYCTL